MNKASELSDPWAHRIHTDTSLVTQQVSHSFPVYISRVIRALLLLRESGSHTVSAWVESQLSYLLPAEPLSREESVELWVEKSGVPAVEPGERRCI